MDKQPLMIDLYCGLGGWAFGGLAEGYRVVGFDIECHEYGEAKYPAQLVIQDVLALHGSQFKDAALIVASPPCQEYSYMAMPWTRAKTIAAEYRSGARNVKKLTALFDACFRIQLEASEAAGRHIPLVVENVRGAQPWVGRAGWHFGSYYLWGDIPALMPITRVYKSSGMNWSDRTKHGQDFTRIAEEQSKMRAEAGVKAGDRNKARANGGNGHQWTTDFNEAIKNNGGSWFNIGSPGQKETNRNPVHEGMKVAGNKLSENGFTIPVARQIDKTLKPESFQLTAEDRRQHLSYSRKAASAAIAKIPFVLAQHIARMYKPPEIA